jgi:predicted amidohydrolase YtcJ
MQAGYGRGYTNMLGLQKAGIKIEDKSASDRDVIERDDVGVATGRVNGLRGIATIRRAIGKGDQDNRDPGIRAIMSALNGFGLTAVYDPGGFGLKPDDYRSLETYAKSGRSTLRVFRSLWLDTPTPADIPKTVDAIGAARGFAGDDMYDLVAIGETVYSPLHDNFRTPIVPSAEQRQAIKNILMATAERGLQYHLCDRT